MRSFIRPIRIAAIARAQGQAVGLADNRKNPDRDIKVQVLDHLLEDDGLLGVFLPEKGQVRLDDMEELEDNRGDSFEVAGPRAAAEFVLQNGNLDGGLVSFGIHLLGTGNKKIIDGLSLQEPRVPVEVPRIPVEVLSRPELEGVDENADHSHVSALPAFSHQA
jgi:hypothetical protein